MTHELDELVRRRAGHRCEYCLLPQEAHRWRFEIDHVIAEQHGGKTESENLALCCPRCNRHKGPNIAGVDSRTGNVVPLFHPRKDSWAEHFCWDGLTVEGRTPAGRATIVTLQLNTSLRLTVRAALAEEGAFPPG